MELKFHAMEEIFHSMEEKFQAMHPTASHEEASRKTRIRYGLAMLLFFLGEIGPIPLMPIIGFFVIIFRPRWFVRHVHRIYCTKSFRKTELEAPPAKEKLK